MKQASTRPSPWRLFLGMAWLHLGLLALAVIALAAGFYIWGQPAWTLREDIKYLNMGVTAFNEPPGVLPPADGRLAEFPIERAAAHWEKAAALSTDNKIKSLAYYNSGTLVGREAWAQALPGEGHARSDMIGGIGKLGEALRADPTNEDAKFNLELMEKAAQQEGAKQGAPGPGYSPGAIEKGF